jgi:2-methylcitrate dehydratase PrpD
MTMSRRKLMQKAALGASAALGAGALPASPQSSSSAAQPPSEGLTRYVAEFIVKTTFADLPAEVLELGKKSILDGIGLALAGSVAETGPLSREYVKSLGLTPGGATVIGSSMKVTPRFAAFLNGVAIHADDYDDTQLAVAKDRVYGLLTHPTAPALPPTLAVGEVESKSGRDVTLAYHLGVEVECKIAEAIAPRHYGEGFHSTATMGAMGSAAAVAKLRGFDAGRTARALSIAASQAAGLRENFGTMTKPFHAGRAAESGVVAADLSGMGWTAAENILEAPRGFFRAAGGGFDATAISGKLGKPWTFTSPGISIKPHPSGSLTHPGMTELQRLIRENKIRAADVEKLEVGTNRYMPTALIHRQPQNSLQAKFSMEFCMAALLLYGKAGLQEFTDEVVRRPEVQSMIKRVQFGVHPEAEAAGYNKMTTILTLHLKGGKTLTGRADFGKGSPANPMSYDEAAAKFLDCAAFARFPMDKAGKIVAQVREMEKLSDVRSLTALCAV